MATRDLVAQLTNSETKVKTIALGSQGETSASLGLPEGLTFEDMGEDVKCGNDAATQDLLQQLMAEEEQEQGINTMITSWSEIQSNATPVDESIKLAMQLHFDDNASSHEECLSKVASPCTLSRGRHRHHEEDELDEEYQASKPKPADHASMELLRRLQLEHADSLLARRLEMEEEATMHSHRRENAPSKCDTIQSLKVCQKKAIQFVQYRAMKLHEQAIQPLRTRIRNNLGREPEELDRCLEYIRDDAPIVIHLKQKTLSKLTKDTHFRSLFETGTSGGTRDTDQRSTWEDRMFGSAYNGCQAQDRCKYGCINVTGDIRGVHAAQRYGKCFLILKSHLRYRTTFFGSDSGQSFARENTKESLATHEFYAHVLQSYTDSELSAVLNLSRLQGASSSGITVYKEVQIHGDVCLSTDIQALSVPGKRIHATPKFIQLVDDFQRISGCNVMWQDDLLGL
eukprot:CAMPEP_0194049162 /NCGR_PEP_ID=MMETSP0009_2-20130614/29874_1 /TAXON_ID=210454 /ORGANISM="Grammatophora oceanica, Strain CCMP 410" /LENGTH=455 /DNA_ID=CAMNT_0038695247 /DNA_START=460 /DNA_END=1827 /DNA_ORIENTATION=+